MPTIHRVRTEGGGSYYANCAWDAVGCHILLRQPVQIRSYCFHCRDSVELALRDERVVVKRPAGVLVHFSKPVVRWYDDVVDTCGRNMNFFSSEQHLQAWRAEDPDKPGYTLTLDQIIEMSRFFYKGRLNLDYRRPTSEEVSVFLSSIGLSGDFWRT
jgi:hypothetical protein